LKNNIANAASKSRLTNIFQILHYHKLAGKFQKHTAVSAAGLRPAVLISVLTDLKKPVV
jgi:hypothetical protein